MQRNPDNYLEFLWLTTDQQINRSTVMNTREARWYFKFCAGVKKVL